MVRWFARICLWFATVASAITRSLLKGRSLQPCLPERLNGVPSCLPERLNGVPSCLPERLKRRSLEGRPKHELNLAGGRRGLCNRAELRRVDEPVRRG